MPELRMPFLGEDMKEGTLLEWRIQPGQTLHRGDIIALVDTEKAEIEIESFDEGVVEKLIASVGDVIPIGAPIAVLAAGGAAGARAREEPARAAAPVAASAASAAPEPAVVPPPPAELPRERGAPDTAPRLRATPLARRRAAELGIDLGAVRGTGPDGAITEADLAAHAGAAAPAQPRAERADKSAAMRRAIAAAMERSKREIPHYYLETEIELGAALAALSARNAARPVAERVLPAAWLLRATARALAEFPELNGFWREGAFAAGDGVHLGVAIFLRGGGLVAPAIRDADRLSLDELMSALRDLVNRARGGALKSSELGSATATVTNLGDQGVEKVFGVIHPPQVALIGFGRIHERPVAIDGLLGIRPSVCATLAADHRASDGQRGARFLARLRELASQPLEPAQ